MKRIPGFLIILMIGTNALCKSGTENLSSDPVKVLFLGASYFAFNNLVDMVQKLADSSGEEVYLDYYFGPGYYLDDHANCSVSDSMIRLQDWDFVFLQGVGSLTAYPDTFTDHKVDPALRILKQKISLACNSAKTVFCLPWAFEDGMTWMGWPDDYTAMQKKIYDNTLQLARGIGFMIAPVGWAWNSVLELKGFPLHYLHRPDWNHPSLEGSYLMACVIFTSIFQETVTGNPYYDSLEKEEAEYLQSVASKTVLGDLELWQIPEMATDIEKPLINPGFQLYQNIPNPFCYSTQIDFCISEEGFVSVKIYDASGRELCTLVNERKPKGKYQIVFDAKDITGGIYYCRLQSGNFSATRKLVISEQGL